MRRRNFLALGVAGVAATGLRPAEAAVAAASPATATQIMMLTGTDSANTVPWQFQVTSGRRAGVWGTIPTPSNWECQGFGTYQWGWNLVPGERGLYRHSFTPPANWAGRRFFLVFEGSMTDTEARVNGTVAGPVHRGGFYRFKYEVTRLIRTGAANSLEVNVSRESSDNSINDAERRGDYWNFSGIYRPVSLQAVPSQYIDRIAVDAKADGSLTVSAVMDGVTAAGSITAQVMDLNGVAVGAPVTVPVASGATRATLSTRLSGVRLWTAETPNLYQVEVVLSTGGVERHHLRERIGFRTIEVRAGNGVYVNGNKVILKGTNRHSFWPTTGRATSVQNSRDDILLMKEMNNNAVRMAHYPPDVHFLDLCDELGLYVIDELAGWQKRYSTAAGTPLVAEMVRRDVNHPSIVMWANGNEGGWNTDLDDDFTSLDQQKRPVIHPWGIFNGIDTDHYETYASTQSKVNSGNIYMPTEFLHAMYDGGGAAGLNDYWKLQGNRALRVAGGFIWAFVDEGLVRADRGGVIDTTGNSGPDGILGPYREKEGSFFTIKDIWSPVQLVDRAALTAAIPGSFNGSIPLRNEYSFINLNQCRFRWELVNFPRPALGSGSQATGQTVSATGTVTGPSVAPGATGNLSLPLPSGWNGNDALRVTAVDPSGRDVYTWVFTIRKAVDVARVVVPAATSGTATGSQGSGSITMSAAGTSVQISTTNGRLLSVTRDGNRVSLTNGPALAAGSSGTLNSLTRSADGAAQIVRGSYSGGALSSVTWRLDANGWLRLQYTFSLTGAQSFVGINFDYPEANVRGVTALGAGPYRVWKNRMRGVETTVWSKDYNDTATGAYLWRYPEFKGYHANMYWAALRTSEGTITMVSGQENTFLRLYTPRVGSSPLTATAPFPTGNIGFLDGIPAIGNKFQAPATLGPESASYVGTGTYNRTVYFRFTA